MRIDVALINGGSDSILVDTAGFFANVGRTFALMETVTGRAIAVVRLPRMVETSEATRALAIALDAVGALEPGELERLKGGALDEKAAPSPHLNTLRVMLLAGDVVSTRLLEDDERAALSWAIDALGARS